MWEKLGVDWVKTFVLFEKGSVYLKFILKPVVQHFEALAQQIVRLLVGSEA